LRATRESERAATTKGRPHTQLYPEGPEKNGVATVEERGHVFIASNQKSAMAAMTAREKDA